MTGRPLHVAMFPAGEQLRELLAAALDGRGPAVAPVDPCLDAGLLRRLTEVLAPSAVAGPGGVTPLPGGQPVRGDTAVVVATSGSTGEPKAAELSAAALVSSASASLRRIGAKPGDRWLCCLPTWHIAGIQVLVRSLLSGTDPLVCAPSDTAAIASAADAGCAHVALVPTQLRRLLLLLGGAAARPRDRPQPRRAPGGALLSPPEPAALSALSTVLLGGSAIPKALVAEARAAGARVVTTYGMTETCGGCVYDGIPLDDVEVRAGADGRIRIAGPVLMSGYRLRPDLTAAAFDGRWLRTRDIGQIGSDGRLVVAGRADDVIATGGEKVPAGEVAAVVETHPAVREAVVFGAPDPEWGERVCVAVVPEDPAATVTLAALRAHVAARLPAFAVPRALVVVSHIPLLAAGKPDLAALRGLAREQSGADSVSN